MITIAWDIDDVLNDLMRIWFKQKWLIDHQNCKIRYEDIAENPPHRLLNTTLERYLKSLDEFRLSAMYQGMSPVKEVMNWFIKNGSNFRHIALTAVPLIAASASAQWVFRHFGTWIRTFHFVPSNRQGQTIPEYERDKGGFLKWISKVDMLVDDSESNIMSAEKVGCKVILMPQPWNISKNTVEETLSMISNLV